MSKDLIREFKDWLDSASIKDIEARRKALGKRSQLIKEQKKKLSDRQANTQLSLRLIKGALFSREI